jgi:hypothetical protein
MHNVRPVVDDVFHEVGVGAGGNRRKHITGREGATIHHGPERSVPGSRSRQLRASKPLLKWIA